MQEQWNVVHAQKQEITASLVAQRYAQDLGKKDEERGDAGMAIWGECVWAAHFGRVGFVSGTFPLPDFSADVCIFCAKSDVCHSPPCPRPHWPTPSATRSTLLVHRPDSTDSGVPLQAMLFLEKVVFKKVI